MSRVHRAVTVLGADPILWSRMDTVDHVESFLEFPGHDRRSKLYQRGEQGGGNFLPLIISERSTTAVQGFPTLDGSRKVYYNFLPVTKASPNVRLD
jgi:hypothetical protein